ncbi:MAG: hypothetical protein OEZ51_12445 [Nitrospinota bacterium]|nr:hypothetical protein [Nitrospinota bacterium]
MKRSQSITVNLAGEYPAYKRDGENLVRLPSMNSDRRYSLTTNVQTRETYYIEFTDEEEAQANLQKAEWEAGAPAREAEAKRQADKAQRFENSLQYKNCIVAFLDILGWKSAVLSKEHENGDVIKVLGKTLAGLQGVVSHFNSLRNLLPEENMWPGNPVMTQFSDSLVISVDDNIHGREALQNAILALTSNLINFGFLLRGGVTRGELFHDSGLVFGPALIEAYKLEDKVAVTPRVILSNELSAEWGGRESSGAIPWIPSSDDDHLFFNFLPPFMGNPFFTDQQLWQSHLTPIRDLILRKAKDPSCCERTFKKYIWLATYFDKVCVEHPNCGLERVLQLAMRIRSEIQNGHA